MSVWFKNYCRDLEIKDMVIVYGNVYDYMNVNDKYPVISDAIVKDVISKRKNVITYDILNGLSFGKMSPEDILSILKLVDCNGYEIKHGQVVAKSNVNAGRRMDGDSGRSLMNTAEPKLASEDFRDIEKFANLVYLVSKSEYEVSFVITVGDSVFGKLGQDELLSIHEKNIFDRLSQAVENLNKETIRTSRDREHQNILIICNKLSTIPSSMHLSNPKVSKVEVLLPTRDEKKDFVIKNREKFKIKVDKLEDFIDSLDGLSLLEIDQIGTLIQLKENQDKEFDKVLSQFRYGNDENPWSELNKKKLMNMEEIIGKRVKSQDEAIKKIKDIVIKAYTGISGLQHSVNSVKPRGTLFFVGPTGVGKTELAKSLAKFLFGDEGACIRFDMSEYNQEHSDQKLIGTAPGYVGYEEGGQLTNKVRQKPFSVLLFDEIEKAHPRILDKFLQILEDGRLTDGKGQTVYFSDTIIIFTSNIGTKDIKEDSSDSKARFKKAVIEYFKEEIGRPEILNRIGEDNIVAFDFIKDRAFLRDIVVSKLENIKNAVYEKYGKANLEFPNEEKVFLEIVQDADVSNGGRGALNDMERYLITPLSEFLFYEGDNVRNKRIKAEYDKNSRVFTFKIV